MTQNLSGTQPNGAAWAAVVAAGVGGAVFGLMTDLSECSAAAAKLLGWYPPAGSLSGVAIASVVIWIGGWIALHARWSAKSIRHEGLLVVTILLLVSVALLATYPPIYEMMGR